MSLIPAVTFYITGSFLGSVVYTHRVGLILSYIPTNILAHITLTVAAN